MAAWRHQVGGAGLFWLSRLIRRSARYQVTGFDAVTAAIAGPKPVMVVAWHGMTMLLAGWLLRHIDKRGLSLIIPDDWRGEVLAEWCRRLQVDALRINLEGDASMASARKLAQVVRHLRGGGNTYITPDGPHGPSYQIKPGTLYLAQRTGALLIPAGAYTRHGYTLNRWDRYTVPYPFSRIAVAFDTPLAVPADADLTEATQNLVHRLHAVTAQAAADYYEQAV